MEGGSESKLQAEVSSLVSILQGSKLPDSQRHQSHQGHQSHPGPKHRSRSREPLRRREERRERLNGRERSERDRDREREELPRRTALTRSEGRDGRDSRHGRDRRERREARGDARDEAGRRDRRDSHEGREGRDRERRDGREEREREERDRHDRHDRNRPPIERRPSHRERSRSGYESTEHRQGGYAAPLTLASQPGEDLRDGDRRHSFGRELHERGSRSPVRRGREDTVPVSREREDSQVTGPTGAPKLPKRHLPRPTTHPLEGSEGSQPHSSVGTVPKAKPMTAFDEGTSPPRMTPPKQDFERIPGEVEQNFEDSFYRALHRRLVMVSGARRCERLLWGPWRRGSTQARGDLTKLEAAHESEDAKVATKLLSVAKALHVGAPPRQDHRGISYGELFRKFPEGMAGFEVEAETFQSSSSRLQTRYKCICYLRDDVRRAGGAKLIEVTGCFQENREKAEADGQAILEAYASGGMSEARQMQRQIMAGMWGTLSAPSPELEEAPEEEGQAQEGAYSQPVLKASKSVTIRPARLPLGPHATKPLSPSKANRPKSPKAAPKSVKAVPKQAATRNDSTEPKVKAASTVKAVPVAKSKTLPTSAPPRPKEPDGPPPGWKAPAQETSSRTTVTEAKRPTGPSGGSGGSGGRVTSTVKSPAGQVRRGLQPTPKASGRPEPGRSRGPSDKDGEPEKKPRMVQKGKAGKAFSKGKEKDEKSSVAVKAEEEFEDFHDGTDEKDLDKGKGRSKVGQVAKGKGGKGKEKGNHGEGEKGQKVEIEMDKVKTKESKKGGNKGNNFKGNKGNKGGKGGKGKKGGKGREDTEKDTEKDTEDPTDPKDETSKDDTNEAAKDHSSAEASMDDDYFGNIGDVWKLL